MSQDFAGSSRRFAMAAWRLAAYDCLAIAAFLVFALATVDASEHSESHMLLLLVLLLLHHRHGLHFCYQQLQPLAALRRCVHSQL